MIVDLTICPYCQKPLLIVKSKVSTQATCKLKNDHEYWQYAIHNRGTTDWFVFDSKLSIFADALGLYNNSDERIMKFVSPVDPMEAAQILKKFINLKSFL